MVRTASSIAAGESRKDELKNDNTMLQMLETSSATNNTLVPDDDNQHHKSISNNYWCGPGRLAHLLMRQWHLPWLRNMLNVPEGHTFDRLISIFWHSADASVPFQLNSSFPFTLYYKVPGSASPPCDSPGRFEDFAQCGGQLHVDTKKIMRKTDNLNRRGLSTTVFCNNNHFEPIINTTT